MPARLNLGGPAGRQVCYAQDGAIPLNSAEKKEDALPPAQLQTLKNRAQSVVDLRRSIEQGKLTQLNAIWQSDGSKAYYQNNQLSFVLNSDGTLIKDISLANNNVLESATLSLPDGRTAILENGAVANTLSADGSVASYKDGLLFSLTTPDGKTSYYSYEKDEAGNIISTAVLRDGTKKTYDAKGNIIKAEAPTESLYQNGTGQAGLPAGQAGTVELHYKDARICEAIMPDGKTYIYSYNGDLTTIELKDYDKFTLNGSGEGAPVAIKLTYNPSGQLVSLLDSDLTQYFYANGLVSKSIAKDGATTAYSYIKDKSGNVNSTILRRENLDIYYSKDLTLYRVVINEADGKTTVDYDKGKISSLVDKAGDIYTYTYKLDSGNQELVSIKEEKTGITRTYKDSTLLSILEPDGTLTELEYKEDKIHRAWISKNGIPIHLFTYAYDGSLTLIRGEDYVTKAYDENNNLVYVKYQDGTKYSYAKMDDGSTLTLEDDGLQAEQPTNKVLLYDKNDRLAKLIRSDGSSVVYEEGRISGILDGEGNLIAQYAYDEEGNLLSVNMDKMRLTLSQEIESARLNILSQRIASLSSLADKALELRNEIYKQGEEVQGPLGSKLSELDEIWRQIGNDEQGAPVKDAQSQVIDAMCHVNAQVLTALKDLAASVSSSKYEIESQAAQSLGNLAGEAQLGFEQITTNEIAPIIYSYYRDVLGRDPDEKEIASVLDNLSKETSRPLIVLLKEDILGKIEEAEEIELQAIGCRLDERTKSLRGLKDTLVTYIEHGNNICRSFQEFIDRTVSVAVVPGVKYWELGLNQQEIQQACAAAKISSEPIIRQDSSQDYIGSPQYIAGWLILVKLALEKRLSGFLDSLSQLVNSDDIEKRRLALERELPDEVKKAVIRAIGGEAEFLEKIKEANDPLELFAGAYKIAIGAELAQHQLDDWLLYRISDKTTPEDILFSLKEVLYESMADRLSPEFRLVWHAESALRRARHDITEFPDILSRDVIMGYSAISHGAFEACEVRRRIDEQCRITLQSFSEERRQYQDCINAFEGILQNSIEEISAASDAQKSRIAQDAQARREALERFEPAAISGLLGRKDIELTYKSVYNEVFKTASAAEQIEGFLNGAGDIAKTSAAEIIKRELISSEEYAEKLAQKERIIQSVEEYFEEHLRAPPSSDADTHNALRITHDESESILNYLRGQSLHFGSSAFSALYKLLSNQLSDHTTIRPSGHQTVIPTYEDLATKAIIADILAGNINKDTTGELVISAYALREAAKSYGVNLYIMESPASPDLASPCITLIGNDHYVVVTGQMDQTGQANIVYYDPSIGKAGSDVTIPLEEFVKVQRPLILAVQKPQDDGLIADERLSHITKGAWKFKDLFSGWFGITLLGVASAVALPFLAPAIAGALASIPVIGSLFSGVTALTSGSFLTNSLINIANIGLSLAATAGLEKIGLPPLFATLGSSMLTGGIIGGFSGTGSFLSGAIQGSLTSTALTGVGLLGDMLKVNPFLKTALMAPLNTLAQNVAGLAVGAKGYSLKDIFQVKMIPNLVEEMASLGVRRFAINAGADPMLASVLSAPIGAALKLSFSPKQDSIADFFGIGFRKAIGAALPYGEEALVDEYGASPVWASLAGRFINGILVRGDSFSPSTFATYLFQELGSQIFLGLGNYLIKEKGYSPLKASMIELAVAGLSSGLVSASPLRGFLETTFGSLNNLLTFGYQQNMTPRQLTGYLSKVNSFTQKVDKKGFLPALATKATTSFRMAAYHGFQSQGKVAGNFVGSMFAPKSAPKKAQPVKTTTKPNVASPVKSPSAAAKNSAPSVITSQPEKITLAGYLPAGSVAPYAKTPAQPTTSYTYSTKTYAPQAQKVDYGENSKNYKVTSTANKTSLIGYISKKSAELTYSVYTSPIMEFAKYLTPAGISSQVSERVQSGIDRWSDYDQVPPYPQKEKNSLIRLVSINGIRNQQPEYFAPDYQLQDQAQLSYAGLDPSAIYLLPLYENGAVFKDSFAWLLDAAGTDKITNELEFKLRQEISLRPESQKYQPIVAKPYSGSFSPLMKTLDENPDLNVETIIAIGGPSIEGYLWKGKTNNPNLKLIVNVWGSEDLVPFVGKKSYANVETINVKILGADHYDYYYEAGGGVFNAKSSRFVIELTKRALNGKSDMMDFLSQPSIAYDAKSKIYIVDPIKLNLEGIR